MEKEIKIIVSYITNQEIDAHSLISMDIPRMKLLLHP